MAARELPVESRKLRHGDVQRVILLDPPSCRFAHEATPGTIPRRRHESPRQSFFVSDGDGDARGLEVGQDTDARPHRGAAARRRLLRHPFLSFVTGAHDEEIGRPVVTGQRLVGQAPVETNPRIDTEGSRQAPQSRRKRPVSYYVEDGLGKLGARASERLEEHGLIFDGNERRHVEKLETSLEE